MADRIQTLLVSLEARINQYESTMRKAIATTNSTARKVESRVFSMNKAVSSAFSGLATGAVGAIASLLTVGTAIAGARQALEKFGDIADQSAAAGIDSEFFQGIAYEASLSGVEIEGVAGALATFAKNSGLAADQKGKLYSTLKAINPELLRSIQLAASQEERIRLAADAISQAKTAAEQAALATTLFGESGTKLVAVFKGGAAALDTMVAKAKELGIVVERSLIEQADELGDKLDTAQQIISTKMNVAFVNLAPLMVDAVGLAAEFAKYMAIVYEQTKDIEQRQFLNPLQNQLTETYGKISEVKENISQLEAQLAGQGGNGMLLEINITDAQSNLAELQAQANALLSRIQEIQGYKPPAPAGPPVDPRDALFAGMTGRGGDGRRRPVEPFYTPGGATAPSSGKNAAQEAIDQAQEVLDSLKFEQEQLARTSTEQAIYNNLKAAGVTAESTFGQQIADATIKLETQRAELEANKAAMVEFGDLAKSATRGFIDDLIAGKSAAEAFGNVLSQIGDKLLDLGLTSVFGGGNSGSGLLGQVFGFASGTANTGGVRGQPRGVVHGQEAVIPLPNGGNVPVDIKMPTAMGSPAPSITYAPQIDARGADPEAIARLDAALAKDRAEFQSKVVATVRKATSTGNLK